MLLASVLAHKFAYEAGVLQRDLSIHNIVFHPESTLEDPKAMLIDWDLCKYTEDLNAAPTQPGGRLVGFLF
jgi:RIO-like serine/threonine protein kinase